MNKNVSEQGHIPISAMLSNAPPRPFSERHSLRRWLVNFPRAIPLSIFAAIIAITALSVYAIESNVRAREQVQMNSYAKSIASELERRGNSFSSYLRSGAALFSRSSQVDGEGFRQFVSELRLNEDYKGVEGIGWIAVVPRTGEEDFVERMRIEQPDFPLVRPRPGASLPKLAVVTYFSPDTARNRALLGYNMYADPVRSAAMDEAKQTDNPIASGQVELLQGDEEGAAGFDVFMPVYNGEPLAGDRDSRLSGFIYAPFNADTFLQAAVAQAAPDIYGVSLIDASTDDTEVMATSSFDGQPTRRLDERITIGERDFVLVVHSGDPQMLAPLSMVTLLFGLAVASLLMLLARLLTQQAHEDRARLAYFEEQNSIRNSLTRELNHRVKNTLANVLSILSLTRRRASNLGDFADSLEGRIRSLSATHDLLTSTDWGTTPVRSVVEAELQHFRSTNDNIIAIDGPPLELAPNDALSFGLAIHELATNAAKFGALSTPDGQVSVIWRAVSPFLAEVEWREEGGPIVSQQRKRGFGTELIEKIVAHELKQPVELDFDPVGVRCVISVPVRQREEFQIREQSNPD